MSNLPENNNRSVAESISNETWSIESAWSEGGGEASASESVDCFHLAEGSELIPLHEEWSDLIPMCCDNDFHKENKVIRIYNAQNRYIDFTWFLKTHYDEYLDLFLKYEDEQGTHAFACYAYLRDLSNKRLISYKMDKHLLKALKRFWDSLEKYNEEQIGKLEYQQMGRFRKFLARHRNLISWIATITITAIGLAVIYLSIIGVHALCGLFCY